MWILAGRERRRRSLTGFSLRVQNLPCRICAGFIFSNETHLACMDLVEVRPRAECSS